MKRLISVTLLICVVFFCFVSCGADTVDELFIGNTDITYEIKDGEATVTKVPNKTVVTKIVIPDEYEGVPVTKIADFSATNLEYVTEVIIGKNVREISDWAFGNSTNIAKYDISDENPYICDVDGVIYTKDMKTILFYPPQRNAVLSKDENGNEVKSISYEIPEGVETIRSKAFYKCSNLTKIKLPSSLKVIEEKAFFICNLKEINLPEGLEAIGKDAFGFNAQVAEITIPASVTRIDEYAFYSCTNMTVVNMQRNEEELTLGKKWYPTNNGAALSAPISPGPLVINWPTDK